MPNIILTANDYGALIDDVDFANITESKTGYISAAELASVIEIQSYIRGKYDLAPLFPVITKHDSAVAYSEGAVVYNLNEDDPENPIDEFFTAKTSVSIGAALEDGNNWAEGDPRDALIREMLVDLTLYRLHSRLSPNQIPEHRIQRRDDAVSWLKSVAKYSVSVGWALEENAASASIVYGSKTRKPKDY